jgi:hypothetical protein
MSARAHLRVVGQDGEVFETSTPEETIRALEAALARAQKTIDGLRGALREERRKVRTNYRVDEVFEDWRAKVVAAGFKGKSRCKLSDDRVDAMAKMFDAGHPFDVFLLVNTGIAEFPYVRYGKRQQSGSQEDVQVDIAYVCEKARRFEEAARLGAIVEKARAPRA